MLLTTRNSFRALCTPSGPVISLVSTQLKTSNLLKRINGTKVSVESDGASVMHAIFITHCADSTETGFNQHANRFYF